MTSTALPEPRPLVDLTVDGTSVSAPVGSTILDACRGAAIDIPTLCYLDGITPANACRVCMVEVEGSRTLVPACSREVSDGLNVVTENDRVASNRRLVFELLASSVDMSLVDDVTVRWMDRYGVDPQRFGPEAATVDQPVKVQDDLYIRDYAKCILCYKCVAACGEEAQNTFAISAADRGFESTISTEFDIALPESACVYCGNCVAVCPTGALMVKTEYDMRRAGSWDEGSQTVVTTICPYCGVGCNLELHVQDNEIVKVMSPRDHPVTEGHLCIKGRFGYQHVQNR
ncbi:MAG: 2Fe-2S iron-sulfur cluster-binding protein [Acidimicrobiia bacterium]|nr:2Fe-2S iron-sulfur cluster-binding protein [Acidimicrobiia bacterium]